MLERIRSDCRCYLHTKNVLFIHCFLWFIVCYILRWNSSEFFKKACHDNSRKEVSATSQIRSWRLLFKLFKCRVLSPMDNNPHGNFTFLLWHFFKCFIKDFMFLHVVSIFTPLPILWFLKVNHLSLKRLSTVKSPFFILEYDYVYLIYYSS